VGRHLQLDLLGLHGDQPESAVLPCPLLDLVRRGEGVPGPVPRRAAVLRQIPPVGDGEVRALPARYLDHAHDKTIHFDLVVPEVRAPDQDITARLMGRCVLEGLAGAQPRDLANLRQ